jgi:acyl dehydratase
VAFAGLSGDFNPLHLDAESTREGMFGGRVAHGLLVLSAATGLAWQLGLMTGTVEAFMGLAWKFRKPVKIGDTIRVELTITQRKAMPAAGGGIVELNVVVKNQRDETVQKGQWTAMVKSRPAR